MLPPYLDAVYLKCATLTSKRFKIFLSSGVAPAEDVADLWAECSDRMYSLPARQRQLGLGPLNGVSTYFSANCDVEDAAVAARFLDSIKLSPYNTRLFKDAGGVYTVRIAAAVATAAADHDDSDRVGSICRTHKFEGREFKVIRGDYAPLMARVVAAVRAAALHAANDQQRAMLDRFAASFELGSIEEHKAASRHWIGDKAPPVESYIGFIESYRDPSGVRGEWEGFVACVNREVSKKFGALVNSAETLLTLFPWPSAFEKDVFLKPDFTSLDVLAFGSSGVPAGINIPNYDDVRQTEGFKNVSLGNVLAASYGAGDKPVTFIAERDQQLFKRLKTEAFEIQVGIHELLGHGSGKLFHQGTRDAVALVESKLEHPITGDPVSGPFYTPGSTWDSTFGKVASSYEECRAECSGIFLCLERQVLQVFGHTAQSQAPGGVDDVVYVNWLLMVRAGLVGLEFYTPETNSWRQAHMQARYVILRVLLEAGDGLVTVTPKQNPDGEPDVEVLLDRSKISTTGRSAIGALLLNLQTHKSLGDVAAGTVLYNKYSEVSAEMLARREIVMARKEPRKLLVQPHLELVEGGSVVLRNFDQSFTGMIESFVARYPKVDPELLALYHGDKAAVSD